MKQAARPQGKNLGKTSRGSPGETLFPSDGTTARAIV
jgi:hypothetical protein